MPRLAPHLLRLAHSRSPFLLPILQECRDLPSSLNELRWLTEQAVQKAEEQHSHRATATNNIHQAPTRILGSRSLRSSEKPRHPRRPRTHPQVLPGAGWRILLRSYVKRRSRGEPLQYILGTQPFGEELEILCEKGVLIPRWETEVWAEKLGGLAGDFLIGEREGKGSGNEGQHGDGDAGPEKGSKAMRSVRVVDLCTGTGCVALGVYEMLSRRLRRMGSKREVGRYDRGNRWYNVNVTGIDISTTALDLARRNLRHNISLGHLAKEAGGDISFIRADVLLASSSSSTMSPSDDNQQQKIPYLLNTLKAQYSSPKQKVKLDILTANPPYISPFHFSPGPSGRTTRSVRKYEPSLALVPGQSIKAPTHIWPKDTTPTPGDEFYYHILPLTFTLDVGVTVLEVGDTEQAHRVVQLARMMASMVGDPEALLELWFDDARTEVWGAEDGVINAGKETTRNMIHEANPDDTSNLGQVDRVSARAVVIWRREWAKWRKRCSSDW